MLRVELSSGSIEYVDNGGHGPVIVFGHGVPMTAVSQWRHVVPLLQQFRCIQPTLPLGGHRIPMKPGADVSQHGVARLLGELLERLDLHDVCLVLNDWGGGQFLLTENYPGADRVSRLVLAACEAFDNFPPVPARKLALAAPIPALFYLILQLVRLRAFRRSQAGYGAMSLRGVPDDVLQEWFRPAWTNRSIRRDFAKFAAGTPSRAELLAASQRLRAVDLPALVVWAAQDRLMPSEHGPRLAEILPRGRLVVVDDSSTLLPEDQPEQLAGLLSRFVSAPAVGA